MNDLHLYKTHGIIPPNGGRTMKVSQKQYEHDQKYIQDNIKFINISLNKKKPEDMEIYEWLNSKGSRGKGAYIKGLIIEDMKKAGR